MNKVILTFLALSSFLIVQAQNHVSERRLKKHKVPQSIINLVSENYSDLSTKIYKILDHNKKIKYEVILKKERKLCI